MSDKTYPQIIIRVPRAEFPGKQPGDIILNPTPAEIELAKKSGCLELVEAPPEPSESSQSESE